jgi:predicted MFS family arabinose efflux permease
VLFAQEELGLGSVGYGLLLTGHGVGGVLGALVATRLSRRLGTAALLVAAVLVRGVLSSSWASPPTPGSAARRWWSRG